MTSDPVVRFLHAPPGPGGVTRPRLRELAHAHLADELGATAVGRLCLRCGAVRHGRPWVRVAAGPAPSVSLAYVDRLVVLAWSWAGDVGVDLAAGGASAGAYGDAVAWTRAEAVLKATGEGLFRDPLDLPDGIVVERLDPGAAWVGHVAVRLSPRPPAG